MDELDYWRLCDELNIVQAALLIAGEAPTIASCVEEWNPQDRPRGYEAAKTAITHGLLSFITYTRESANNYDQFDQEFLEPLRRRSIEGQLIPHYDSDMNGNTLGPIEGTVDVYRSKVVVESLKQWLLSRGFRTGFFFPEPVASGEPEYLDPRNPRYTPKLAAAVRAWQAVTNPGKKSAKQALDKWLREHASEFGLTDDDGNPVNQAIEECSKVANWNTSGGAPKTPGQA